MPNLAEHCLVILDAPSFHGTPGRLQQLAGRLAAHLPVLYVETGATGSGGGGLFKKAAVADTGRKGLSEVAPNLSVLRLAGGPPTPANIKKWGSQVEQQLTAMGRKQRILMLGHPRAIDMVAAIPHALTIYDNRDAFAEFPDEAKTKEQTVAYDARALKEADLVFCAAKNLYKRSAPANPHTYLIPNAADIAHFQQEQPPKPKKDYGVDIDKLAAQGKVVGFVGTLSQWFDTMLMISTAQLNPRVSFVFIGPEEADLESLKTLRNTHFTGRMDYADVPYFVSKFDACIIPFVNSPVTDHANLSRLYNYLATGKPIVTTDIPEVRDYEGLIQIGNNGRSFYTKLEMELNLSGNTPQKPWVVAKRAEVAEQNTWDVRVARIVSLIEGALAGQYPEPTAEDTAKVGAGAAQYKAAPVAAHARATAAAAVAAEDHGHGHGDDGHHH